MLKISITLLFISTFTLAQIDDNTNESYESNEAVSDTLSMGEENISHEEESTPEEAQEVTQPILPPTVSEPVNNEQLRRDGTAKKSAGVALTVVGGIFMVGTLTYTVLFIIDNKKFGIPLCSHTSGNMRYDFYLNPGLFGLAIAAPCLATGIVNLIKGNIMIEDARKGGRKSSLKINPYLAYSYKTNSAAMGISVNF